MLPHKLCKKTEITRFQGTISFNLLAKGRTINVITDDLGDHFAQQIESVTWRFSKSGYVVSKIGSLHRLVYSSFLGRRLSSKEIVDHLNNNIRFDCRLDNLNLLTTSENVSKGNGLDKKISQVKNDICFSIHHLSNELFQIAIAPQYPKGPYLLVDSVDLGPQTIYLNYATFDRCSADATEIILDLETTGKIDCSKLHYDAFSYEDWATQSPSANSLADITIDTEGHPCLILHQGRSQLVEVGPSLVPKQNNRG
jgi:hypothetical protein